MEISYSNMKKDIIQYKMYKSHKETRCSYNNSHINLKLQASRIKTFSKKRRQNITLHCEAEKWSRQHYFTEKKVSLIKSK